TLRGGVADGRVLTGRQALEAGLVDQVGYIEDACALAKELGKAPEAKVVRYRATPSLLGALGLASARAEKPLKVELDVTGGTLPRLTPGMMYFLPPWLPR
ncbi:MAG TPA: S49 family peptidase, partial [Prosthecobacter sp.]|nr:S49 family peptidase [Prosthecobacter sp.]